MPKNQKSKLNKLVVGAMMAALSIVLERVISITPASNIMDVRISLSNVPIILAGTLASPTVGALCGAVSDIVGCFISGYAPFPVLTLAPIVMGTLPALLLKRQNKNTQKLSFPKVALALVATHLVASFLITTIGLCIMRGIPFVPMLVTRIPSCTLNLVIDIALVYLLLKSPLSKNI